VRHTLVMGSVTTIMDEPTMPVLPRDHLGRMAFSSARAAMFVSLRAPVYFYNIVAPDGWVQGRPVVLGGTLAAAGIDAVVGWQLRRQRRSLLPVRLVLDLTYVCLAAIAVPPTWPYSGVLLILAPTMIELVAVHGLLLGSLFAIAANLDMYFARKSVGANPYTFELFFYGCWILAVGTGAFAMIELAGRQHQRRFLSERQAFRNLVVLQTRNEFLLGRGGAVTEALNRAWYQLQLRLGRVARAAREEFREQQVRLADETRQQAMYLGDVLSEIAAAQRSDRPAVAEHLHLTIKREQRLQVLTPAQAAALVDQLTPLNLTGPHLARVEASDQITGELQLRIGDHSLHVPAARGRRLALVPAAVIFGSGSLIALVNPIYGDLPLAPVLLAIVSTMLLGLAAERKRRKNAQRGLRYLWLATLSPALLTLFMTAVLPVHWKLTGGRIIMPAMIGLTASLYMLGIIWLELSWRIRGITTLFCATWLVIAIEMNPYGAPPLWSIIGNLAIPASVILAVLSFDSRNRDLGLRLHDQWVAALHLQANEIRHQSIGEEIHALQRQIEAATRLVGSTMDDHGMQEASRHLSEAEFYLDTMRPADESKYS
jgi:hypothetical protein